MNMTEALRLPPPFTITRVWEVLKEWWVSLATVFTQDGEEEVSDFINGDSSPPANYYIAWGTGTGGAVKGDSGLGTPAAETRVIGANTQPSADINQWVGTITSLSGQDISEVGLFDLITGGILFIRKDFTPITLETDDQIEFTITLEMS